MSKRGIVWNVPQRLLKIGLQNLIVKFSIPTEIACSISVPDKFIWIGNMVAVDMAHIEFPAVNIDLHKLLRIQQTWEYSREKSYVRPLVQCEFSIIFASDIIVSCMSSSTTWTLYSVLIFSGCAGLAIPCVWRRMLRRDEYLMRVCAEVGDKEDIVFVGRINSRQHVLRQAEIR